MGMGIGMGIIGMGIRYSDDRCERDPMDELE
jgi:hypothetical protein